MPDYLASLVMGNVPDPARDQWAVPREADLWVQFQHDRQVARTEVTRPFDFTAKGEAAVKRWFWNYGAPPQGWPGELGYWVGMRIAQAYVDRAEDKRVAIAALIRLGDPAAILAASGYGPRR